MAFKQNYLANVFQSHTVWLGNFRNVKQALENHIAKKINLELNLSLITDKAVLYSKICSEMNTTLITNKILL